jgi:AcrR family transcriptional regulator
MTRDRLRVRFGGGTREQIKQAALRQLAEGGAHAVSINAIARELDVSGPALYRYFRGRDELLTALIIDAYQDLAHTLETATTPRRGRSAESRLRSLAGAYRDWALEQPHRYRLMFRQPVVGYDPHADELVNAARQAMTVLFDILRDTPAGARAADTGQRDLAGWIERHAISADAAPHALQAIVIWTRLHGLASLEIEGNYASVGLNPARLYVSEVMHVLREYPAAGHFRRRSTREAAP